MATSDRPAHMLDPDTRFLLANERTLLAWVRTALALMAGGLAFTQIGAKTLAQTSLGLIVILSGALVAVTGYQRYLAADIAIRAGRLPGAGHGPGLQVAGIVFLAFGLAVTRLLGVW